MIYQKNGVLRHPQDPTFFLDLKKGHVFSAYAVDGIYDGEAGPYRMSSEDGIECAFDDPEGMEPSVVGVAPRKFSQEEFLNTNPWALFDDLDD